MQIPDKTSLFLYSKYKIIIISHIALIKSLKVLLTITLKKNLLIKQKKKITNEETQVWPILLSH